MVNAFLGNAEGRDPPPSGLMTFGRQTSGWCPLLSQSESMAATAITRISRKSCKVPLLGLRGSSISVKQLIKDTPLFVVTLVAQRARVDVIFNGFTRCLHKVLKVND